MSTLSGLLLAPRRAPRSLYDAVSEASAAVVIRRYSTSFRLASRLLPTPERTRIANVYALVRVADEIVDEPDPAFTGGDRARLLAELRDDVHRAMACGRSANLVVHAFARTARECGIGPDLVDPFFESMSTDLSRSEHDEQSFARYVHGSAEVVGLMCLRVFLAATDPTAYDTLAPGARALGAAFQKVNFLRDLAADHEGLGRSYFPGVDVETFDDAERDRLLDDIDRDLALAAAAIPGLPPGPGRAVRAAHATFSELSRRLRDTPAAEIGARRVRVPGRVKARLLAGALVGGGPTGGVS